MACPLRSVLVVFSALLTLYIGISSCLKRQSPRVDVRPAAGQVGWVAGLRRCELVTVVPMPACSPFVQSDHADHKRLDVQDGPGKQTRVTCSRQPFWRLSIKASS